MTESIIAVDDAVKTFGDRRALDGLSQRVPPGVVFGLLGPNGAGKTTLIRVLATLLPLDAGTARVAGHHSLPLVETAGFRVQDSRRSKLGTVEHLRAVKPER